MSGDISPRRRPSCPNPSARNWNGRPRNSRPGSAVGPEVPSWRWRVGWWRRPTTPSSGTRSSPCGIRRWAWWPTPTPSTSPKKWVRRIGHRLPDVRTRGQVPRLSGENGREPRRGGPVPAGLLLLRRLRHRLLPVGRARRVDREPPVSRGRTAGGAVRGGGRQLREGDRPVAGDGGDSAERIDGPADHGSGGRAARRPPGEGADVRREAAVGLVPGCVGPDGRVHRPRRDRRASAGMSRRARGRPDGVCGDDLQPVAGPGAGVRAPAGAGHVDAGAVRERALPVGRDGPVVTPSGGAGGSGSGRRVGGPQRRRGGPGRPVADELPAGRGGDPGLLPRGRVPGEAGRGAAPDRRGGGGGADAGLGAPAAGRGRPRHGRGAGGVRVAGAAGTGRGA